MKLRYAHIIIIIDSAVIVFSAFNIFVRKWFSFRCVRWEAIANFLKIHIADSDRSAKEVLAKAKQLQKNGNWHYVMWSVLLLYYMAEVQLQ